MDDARSFRRFALGLGSFVAVLILLPLVLQLTAASGSGTWALGYPYNTDDHMVYAAWIRQAAEGRFLFENRFTLDPQPGLTFNFFFLVLGWLSLLLGTLGATVLAQIGLAFAVSLLAADLIARVFEDALTRRIALALALFGAGLGVLQFRHFGVALGEGDTGPFAGVLNGALPADVWQPEAFVFSSLFTNALFGWALALILVVIRSVALVREDKRQIVPGFVAMLLLANTHSYDALLVGMVMVAIVTAGFASKSMTKEWFGRGGVIALGVALPGAWLAYVLKADPVFAARAATPTYTENFRSLLFGVLPLALLALIGLFPAPDDPDRPRKLGGLGAYALLVMGLFTLAGGAAGDAFFLSPGAFVVVLALAVASAALVADGRPVRDALVAWAFVGLVAPYFPALFQRKLAMGLSLPWAILAAAGVMVLLKPVPATTRRLAMALPLLILCATSARWIARMLDSISTNVANTTVHPVLFPPETRDMVAELRKEGRAATFLAPPGIPTRAQGVDRFGSPLLADLNPVLVGMAGARGYAAHWSETPDYNARRGEVSSAYFGRNASAENLAAFARSKDIGYVVVPKVPDQLAAPLAGMERYGERLVDGERFALYRLR